ncbi:PRC-barrel domain containing protein [Duganella sp. FT50W]|uniref:PRC-barrel domain containing protein n=1 Tax=Duganella lactea TaxID=2692173 RepID=A0A6L8MGQ6_9BURK|nr:PRC-barrel domain-containing protein [Duganella lactea]MYM80906.1 PRC-barrel domain containing protein [Duganella lactea]
MSYLDRDTYGIYRSDNYVDTDNTGPGPRLMGADTLIGEDVYNRQDEDLGDIKEIMLDIRTGQVAYAVLSFGGWMGMGDKLFAVPWQALQLDTINQRFLLDVSKDHLKNAPGFDKDNWPDMASTEFNTELHSFYGTQQNVAGGVTSTGSVMGTGTGTGSLQSDPGYGSTTGGGNLSR